MSTDPRALLAARQRQFLGALVGEDAPPEGIDPIRLAVAAESLARKRARGVAKAWPDLARALGGRFFERFSAYAARQTLPSRGGALADGAAFAQFLARSDDLADAGRREWMAVRLHFAQRRDGLARRRSPAIASAFLRQSRKWVIAVRIPWIGEHWLSLPVGRSVSTRGQSAH